MKPKSIIYITSLIIFTSLIIWSYIINNTAFIPETIIFIIITTILYTLYDKLNLNPPIFAIIILSLIPHSLGFLGFYANSPIPNVKWETITHFLPALAFSLFFFNLLHKYMNKKTIDFKTGKLIALSILATLGIGVIIELVEFFGFLIFGFGKGGLAFGAGDTLPNQIATTTEEITKYGGGWFNTMYDLIWNTLGTLSGTLIMTSYHYILKQNPNKIKSS